VVIAATRSVRELKGRFGKPTRTVSIEEMNAASQEHDDSDPWELYEHPLVTSTADFGERLWRDLIEGRGIDEGNSPEHPLLEIANGVMFAGVKLSGALDRTPDESWPPDPLFAGDILVRLKKARGHLHDALAGLRSAENDDLLRGVAHCNARVGHLDLHGLEKRLGIGHRLLGCGPSGLAVGHREERDGLARHLRQDGGAAHRNPVPRAVPGRGARGTCTTAGGTLVSTPRSGGR
jgi:hypothetical protein